MFKLFSLTERRVKKITELKPTITTLARIEIVLAAIEEIQKIEIRMLNQFIEASILGKDRLKTQDEIKNKLNANNIKNITYKNELEIITRNIQIHIESIKDLNLYISKKIFKINAEIDNITEEISLIIKELDKSDHYYLTNLKLKLYEQNEIIKKSKVVQKYIIENTKVNVINFSKELNNISDILAQILQYSQEFEKHEIINLKK